MLTLYAVLVLGKLALFAQGEDAFLNKFTNSSTVCAEPGVSCIRKCCPYGYDFTAKKSCTFSNSSALFEENVQNLTRSGKLDNYAFLVGSDCAESGNDLFPLDKAEDTFFINDSDLVWDSLRQRFIYNFRNYCVDYMEGAFLALFCHLKDSVHKHYTGISHFRTHRCY